MKVTVDANVLFACLLKDGQTRRLWFNPELELFAPKFIITEFLKYNWKFWKKFGGSPADFKKLLDLVISQVQLIPDPELVPFLSAAASLSNDSKDWLYLASSLKEDTIIWSNDDELKKQTRVKIMTTKEMTEKFGVL